MAERVLLLLGPSTGGIRRHVSALAMGLAERGWEVATAGPRGVLDGLPLPSPPAVVDVPGGIDPRSLVRARRQLAELADDVDVVHAHGLRAGWVAALAARHRPLVVTVHNVVLDEVDGRRAPMLRRVEARLPALCDAVVAVSDEIAERLAPVTPPGRLHTVPPVGPRPVAVRSAGEVRAELGVGGAPLVVTVARLHPQKGLATLLDAAALLVHDVRDVRVVIVGEGPLEAELQARIEALHLDEVVQLAGSRPQAADELAAADVVAVPSVWESGPLVVAEALQLGRPVVATPVGFVPRLLVDGRSARIVPARDPAALAAALADVLRDPAAAAAMAAEGRRAVEAELGPERLVAAIEAVYRGMLSAP